MKSRKHNILQWFRDVLNRIYPDNASNSYLYNNMDEAIEMWLDIYYDTPFWTKEAHNKTLNLGTSIASEFARLIMVEFKSEVTGSERAEFINKQYQRLIDNLRTELEEACAIGGIMFKPYVKNGVILTDCITQDNFIPLAYNSEGITGAGFIAREINGKHYYTRLERQFYDYDTKTHTIDSKFFDSTSPDTLGKEIKNSNMFPGINPHYEIHGVDRPLFAFWRVPFANHIDKESPLGVSVYSRAVKQLREADLQWDRYLWEFKGGELAVHASEFLLKTKEIETADGKIVRKKSTPNTTDRLFIKMNTPNVDEKIYEVFNPTLRDESYARGLNKIKQEIEFECSLAYGTISDPQNVDKTATEILNSKQRSYTAVSDMQKSLQNALEDYIYALDVYTSVCHLAPSGNYETQFDWGDGVLEDKDKEQAIQLQEVNSGIRKKIDYIMWRYGVTEKKAMEMLPESGIKGFFEGES